MNIDTKLWDINAKWVIFRALLFLSPSLSLSLFLSPSLPLSLPLSFQINASHLARANSQKVQQAQMVLMHKCNLVKECQRQPRKDSK